MRPITKGSSNTITLSLAELQTIATASVTFLFEFVSDSSNIGVTCIAADTSAYPERYNTFSITETASPTPLNGEVTLTPSGYFTYNIYEQTSTTNLDVALADKLIASGKVRVVGNFDRQATAYTEYDNPADTQVFWDVAASQGEVITPPTTDVTYENSDQSFTATIPKGTTYTAADINFTDSDGTTTPQPSNIDLVCTPAAGGSGILYKRPIYSGFRTSFATYDDRWQADNGTYDYNNATPATIARLDLDNTYPFHFLIDNNSFGSKSRFTDENGDYYTNPFDASTATDVGAYGSGYLIDHLTGLGWKITSETSAIWVNALSNANSKTYATFTDWRVSNVNEIISVLCWDESSITGGSGGTRRDGLQWMPFDQGLASTEYFTSSIMRRDTSRAVTYFASPGTDIGININREIRTNSLEYWICRNHFT